MRSRNSILQCSDEYIIISIYYSTSVNDINVQCQCFLIENTDNGQWRTMSFKVKVWGLKYIVHMYNVRFTAMFTFATRHCCSLISKSSQSSSSSNHPIGSSSERSGTRTLWVRWQDTELAFHNHTGSINAATQHDKPVTSNNNNAITLSCCLLVTSLIQSWSHVKPFYQQGKSRYCLI